MTWVLLHKVLLSGKTFLAAGEFIPQRFGTNALKKFSKDHVFIWDDEQKNARRDGSPKFTCIGDFNKSLPLFLMSGYYFKMNYTWALLFKRN